MIPTKSNLCTPPTLIGELNVVNKHSIYIGDKIKLVLNSTSATVYKSTTISVSTPLKSNWSGTNVTGYRIIVESDGRPTIYVDGYDFGKHYTKPDGGIRWRCRRYHRECKAVIMTHGSRVLRQNLDHNH